MVTGAYDFMRVLWLTDGYLFVVPPLRCSPVSGIPHRSQRTAPTLATPKMALDRLTHSSEPKSNRRVRRGGMRVAVRTIFLASSRVHI
jgi:hypothetical protein